MRDTDHPLLRLTSPPTSPFKYTGQGDFEINQSITLHVTVREFPVGKDKFPKTIQPCELLGLESSMRRSCLKLIKERFQLHNVSDPGSFVRGVIVE